MTEGRHKVFLRNTAGKNADGRYMINLPFSVWESLGWEVNDNLQIDVIKSGMDHSITITKEKENG